MKETIQFASKDGLPITADVYRVEKPRGFILLCHQARFSRGEYSETAPKLNQMGYSCMAIDQRSGDEARGVINETHKLALEQGLATDYLDAKPDIDSAIDYAYELNGNKPIILVGSSYSAAMALLIGAEGNDKLKAIVSFSPGEYLEGTTLTDKLSNITIPTLVLSSKSEVPATEALLANADKALVEQFEPEGEGIHGSKALWSDNENNEEYWSALREFLSNMLRFRHTSII